MELKDEESRTNQIEKDVSESDGTSKVSVKLETDEKVLARVTDGIYRLPGSAIRELISNSYDADAENVIIDTDVPRFRSMTIRDDGNGMSIEVLVNLVSHIGGSAKRSDKGRELSVTDSEDKTKSPNKNRKLIGKIGIGLFSVAQLTREFDIITKVKGVDYYLKAKIKLYNYSDENTSSDERGASFETGSVEMWKEPTDNLNAHGTDIVLNNIKESARSQLRSEDIWGQVGNETEIDEADSDFLNSAKLELPSFHVGYASGENGLEQYSDKDREPKLPWGDDDSQDTKFSKLNDSLLDLTKNTVSPKLNIVLDNYLNMLWTLGLSVPLNYIDGHPFDADKTILKRSYLISNKRKGQVVDVPDFLDDHPKPFKDILGLETETVIPAFNVIVDGVKLFRPLKHRNLPVSKAKIKEPILFIGKYSPNLGELDTRDSGGELSFECYVMWSPKIIPRDHTGVLIRLHNASGILFDETFMKHQVAEHTIKSQLTAEIYVNKGLDSALNIDRESFNISHPHYQIMMRWFHQAIRQVVNKIKVIRKEVHQESSVEHRGEFDRKVNQPVEASLIKRGLDPIERTELHLYEDESEVAMDSFSYNKNEFLKTIQVRSSDASKSHRVEIKLQAILQILDSYDLLDNLSVEKQTAMIEDLINIISVEG
jgi:hypothetical protein